MRNSKGLGENALKIDIKKITRIELELKISNEFLQERPRQAIKKANS